MKLELVNHFLEIKLKKKIIISSIYIESQIIDFGNDIMADNVFNQVKGKYIYNNDEWYCIINLLVHGNIVKIVIFKN